MVYARNTPQIVVAEVSFDRDHVYFYVHTREKLTDMQGPNWMRLWIDSDRNAQTSWLGYDCVINRQPTGLNRASSEHGTGISVLIAAGKTVISVGDHEIELRVPRSELPSSSFDFKWTDNAIESQDWTDFTLHGDAAPNDRFNYLALLTD